MNERLFCQLAMSSVQNTTNTTRIGKLTKADPSTYLKVSAMEQRLSNKFVNGKRVKDIQHAFENYDYTSVNTTSHLGCQEICYDKPYSACQLAVFDSGKRRSIVEE